MFESEDTFCSIRKMPIVMCLHPDGTTRSFTLNHNKAYTYFGNGSITFCGSIPDLNLVAIARRQPQEGDKLNEFSKKFPNSFDSTYGDILLVGSDQNGEECDVDILETLKYLN